MKSQWDCLLENLGSWHGSFTRFSPSGELIEDVPSIVSFTGLNDNQTMRQIVRLEPANQPVSEKVLEYSSLGRNILFFENGAFSLGSIQRAPFSEFGAELGLIHGDRRLRLVQLFDKQSQLSGLTLIREKLAESETPERPPLQVEDLIGTWKGEATTIYPDWRSPDTYTTDLKVWRDGDRLNQELQFGRTITTSALIEGTILKFDSGSQIVMLPDGASSNCPTEVKSGYPFVLEVGWLLQPDLRQRLMRSYSHKGEWVSLTLVTEQKIS
ncbi:hypothetical protein NIES2135_47070 [Leptolyngbya boryana NIES-2135]|jgi:hypothetical protein|uniref:Uncharacterized protein n=1 Tax=Leptolyngbya boryana NIES-2135 TaxID=1973484 RepID=A0A1Z4JMB0_LEPBY|nr:MULTISPECIES: DUF3598 family protein [Leptolyngbya]BAY57836.1 hypothetical protein NIES2135_47070 [Leptolyngbya boryana NIES-2135]MBD2367281.1 DUF3598 family protein [Leptolyngbya sp. FACHB-161]MBD2373806.1 DUF3598 family protein [Leptolyngbya sp. FACHB-238]MBD2398395.1 DUF3598 family protein [Leptolyngbya sp. FACHB-239]MBD2404108.1 DUF3598 family protein [Leptolyngbya sp. FACHB-402]